MKIFNGVKDSKLFLISILNSLGVLVYVSLVVTFMSNAEKIFGSKNNSLTGIIILLLFILSALITASLVLGRPVLYYLDSKKPEAIKLLLYTMGDLFLLFIIVSVIFIIVK